MFAKTVLSLGGFGPPKEKKMPKSCDKSNEQK